ncbi:ATP-binding protein [Butyrivibrio sp. WCE2006]|uniref:ATP-binding protein n=1 Tax=Butyrivibrio sp. WCE2006 TaxID=1410611 RepID=UPI000679E788|nr:ATP-binding protein [Butyrivibrio sp. WCE2006]
MQIRIVFYKTSSKYYDPCCLKCECFEQYSSEKSSNTIDISAEEIRTKQVLINHVLGIVKNWSKTEYYVDGKRASISEIEGVVGLANCEKAKDNEVVGDHCFDINGWGCNSLEEIAFRDSGYSYYRKTKYFWYQIGKFSDGVWHVDKSRIKEMLKDEAERKHLNFCKHFSLDRIFEEVDKLSDEIIVDEQDEDCEWQYVYKEAAAGMKQTEIIGVEPKEEDKYSSGGFSINVGSLFGGGASNAEEKDDQKDIPSTSFADIGGMDDVVQQVREVVELPMISPNIFEHYHLIPHKGILLYGPPGCGKTMIAKAIANEVKAHFISVNGPEILNKFMGQSEENLRKIFAEAKRKEPAIIYFDEFDSISMRRDSDDHLSSASVVNQLLTLMDGMDESKVCCIASTNRIDMIDEAIKRPGRFDYVIEIEKPSLEGCRSIFRIHTEKKPVDPTFDKDKFVEKHLMGLSGAEIAFVAAEAAYNSIRRTIDVDGIFQGKNVELTGENMIVDMDFIRAVNTLKERKTKADTAKYRYNL